MISASHSCRIARLRGLGKLVLRRRGLGLLEPVYCSLSGLAPLIYPVIDECGLRIVCRHSDGLCASVPHLDRNSFSDGLLVFLATE